MVASMGPTSGRMLLTELPSKLPPGHGQGQEAWACFPSSQAPLACLLCPQPRAPLLTMYEPYPPPCCPYHTKPTLLRASHMLSLCPPGLPHSPYLRSSLCSDVTSSRRLKRS